MLKFDLGCVIGCCCLARIILIGGNSFNFYRWGCKFFFFNKRMTKENAMKMLSKFRIQQIRQLAFPILCILVSYRHEEYGMFEIFTLNHSVISLPAFFYKLQRSLQSYQRSYFKTFERCRFLINFVTDAFSLVTMVNVFAEKHPTNR